jgi:hypothetical protein
MTTAKYLLVFLVLGLCACTEDSFRKGGRDILAGACAKSSNCTINCPEGQSADSFGKCVPAH